MIKKKKTNRTGKKYGPPPKKGPSSQGMELKDRVMKLKGGGGQVGGTSDMSASGAGAANAPGKSSTPSGNQGRDLDVQQRGMSKADYAKSKQTQNFKGKDNTITPRPGPFKVPTIGLATYAINKISKSLYDAKNLKEQKKVDALGGEMLTKKKRIPPPIHGGGRDSSDPLPRVESIDANAPKKLPIGTRPVVPYTFNFQYKEGGMVRGSGKILKGRIKKTRIF